MSIRHQPALEMLGRPVDGRVEVWRIGLQRFVLLNNVVQNMSEEAGNGGTMRPFEHLIEVAQGVNEASGKPDEHRNSGEFLYEGRAPFLVVVQVQVYCGRRPRICKHPLVQSRGYFNKRERERLSDVGIPRIRA